MNKWKLRWFCGTGILLISVISATVGLQVTITQSQYEVARGDPLSITCTFQPKNQQNSLIIVTWTGDPDESFDDTGISFGTFYSNDNHVDIDPMYEGKASIETDVTTRVSKLILKQVTLREGRRIKCRVQIPGDDQGQTIGSTEIVVLVAPSDPVCKIKGTAEYGYNLTLTCNSEEGSPVPSYKWESYDVRNTPRPFPPRTTEKDGVLSLFNVSIDTSGYYICTATNKIRSTNCNLTLSVMPSSMNIGATAGILGGCVAGIAIIVLIIYCCCKDKEKPEEFPMGPLVEDNDEPTDKNKTPMDIRKVSIEGNSDQKERLRSSNQYLDDSKQDRSLVGEVVQRAYYNDPKGHYNDRRDHYEDRRDRQSIDSKEHYDNRSDRYDDRREHYDNQSDRYDDRRDRYDDRSDRYDDRRDRYDDRRDRYDDRRDRYDDRRGHYDDRQDRYADRRDRYDDRQERNDDRRDRYNDRQDRYDDPRDRYSDH